MIAIILAGGLGSRLRPIVPDLPKPLAPIRGSPFLSYLLKYLKQRGLTEVILSVGYKQEAIMAAIGTRYEGLPVRYAVEEQPLGTGGAIRHALRLTPGFLVFVQNGDTFVGLDYVRLWAEHHQAGAAMTMALVPVPDTAA